MFIEKIKSEGLAHLSWVVGDGIEAAVIDPRRDCAIYAEMAAQNGAGITHIFETHRNEDLVSGSAALSKLTGAPVHHGPNPAGTVRYADTVREGRTFQFGDLTIKVLETPGHTDDSLSFAVYDRAFGERAVGVFTGDALFVGDVGRTDFYPERANEVAGLLYDSLQKLLTLGDQAILWPAHGAGSVCGSGMASREFSTLGYERLTNPMLQTSDRKAFIERKVAEHHYLPPYFREMERLNLEGADMQEPILPLPAIEPDALAKSQAGGAVVVDIRSIEAWCAAHVPKSLSIPVKMVPAFAGWFLSPKDALVLVAAHAVDAETAKRHLSRIGFDRVTGYLDGLDGWVTGGRDFESLPMIHADTVRDRLEKDKGDWQLLDVRDAHEVQEQGFEQALHIYVGELPAHLDDLERDCALTVMCGSGQRATVAASVLRRAGFDRVDVFLGSMSAWQATQ